MGNMLTRLQNMRNKVVSRLDSGIEPNFIYFNKYLKDDAQPDFLNHEDLEHFIKSKA